MMASHAYGRDISNWRRLGIGSLAICWLLIMGHAAAAAEAFRVDQVMLYNSISEFELRSPAALVMGQYLTVLEAKASELWAGAQQTEGKDGLIAVAIRPNRTMRLWIDVEGQFQLDLTESMMEKLQDVGVPRVAYGPVGFALYFTLWGGSGREADAQGMRIPEAWRDAGRSQRRRLKVPDDYLPLVWKTESDDREAKPFIPEGFVLQELKPVGGSILCPRDWFYAERHKGPSLMWVISKEDPSLGRYETGVTIQYIIDVKNRFGTTPGAFVQSLIEQKTKTAKVIHQGRERRLGRLTQADLVVEETVSRRGRSELRRASYFLLWNDEADLAIALMRATTPEQWDKYKDILDVMRDLNLCDMETLKRGGDRPITSTPPAQGWREITNASPRQPEPEGYEWVEIKPLDAAFLKLAGWQHEISDVERGQVFRMQQEPLDQPMSIGLTVEVVKDCQTNVKMKPTDYFRHYFQEYVNGARVISVKPPLKDAGLTVFRAEIDKALAGGVTYRVLLTGVANDKTGTVQIAAYRCPLSQWSQHKSTALPIVQNMIFSETL